jgi:hypothetical protein
VPSQGGTIAFPTLSRAAAKILKLHDHLPRFQLTASHKVIFSGDDCISMPSTLKSAALITIHF